MKYRSTRGGDFGVKFREVLLTGYASDGGMYLPESIPHVPVEVLEGWAKLSYPSLAYEVCSLYVDEEDIPAVDLKDVLVEAFSVFPDPKVIPVHQLTERLSVAELYHGPSMAFKDLAMCCMGRFYDYFLRKSSQHMTLVVCTSGDTGSSAIEAVRRSEYLDIIVILPRGRCTILQEKQMTTVLDGNVHVYRADGTSDDIDLVVRELFADPAFVSKHRLGSASSLNFARILIQLVHFFYTYLRLCPEADQELEVVLPTGGAGNAIAGLLAKQMGLPVKLVCAVNQNNVLSRIMETGQCDFKTIQVTLAPAMDIQFAYNLERIWYLCSSGDSDTIRRIMCQVEDNHINIPNNVLKQMKSAIQVYTVSEDEEIKETIRRCWQDYNYSVCPHTAVGLSYIFSRDNSESAEAARSVVFATASPLKFPEALRASGTPVPTSEKVERILSSPTRYVDLELGQNWTEVIRTKIQAITSQLIV